MLGFFSNYIIYKNKIEKGKVKYLNYLLSNFVSYSQDFEDFILFYLFYDIEKGFYIDVGANDPDIFSVTKAFYYRGWNGINIEQLPWKYKLLIQNRPRDINLQYGIRQNEGNGTIIDFGLCSSLFYDKKENNSIIININIKTMLIYS